jgi:hypothetical protein
MLLSILMASVLCLYFSMQEEDILEHTKVHIPKTITNKKSPLCTACMHLLLPNVCMCYIVVVNVTYFNADCHLYTL